MAFDIQCEACWTTLEAEHTVTGEHVQCPSCQHVFVAADPALAINVPPRPPVVDLPPDFELYAPRAGRPRTIGSSLNTAFFGWADRYNLGRGPAAAFSVALVLAVFGIVSPAPLRLGMLALPVWALVFLACGMSIALGRESEAACRTRRQTWRRPFDLSTLVARSGLIAAAGAAVALWGIMIHGREVFDLAGQDATPVASMASAGGPAMVATRSTPAEAAAAFELPALAVVAPVAPPAAPPVSVAVVRTPMATPVPVTSAALPPLPPPVAADPVMSVSPAPSVQADADVDESARVEHEDVSASHLRILCEALNGYARQYGRYPATLDALPRTSAVAAARRSPFDHANGTTGYTLAAAGQHAGAGEAAGLAVIYDAAEVADRGTAVGITAGGRLVYLDADQVNEQRAAWSRAR